MADASGAAAPPDDRDPRKEPGDKPRTPEHPPSMEPPPLLDVRVRGRGAKGLNKKAIVIVAGGGLGLVLVLASTGLSGDSSRKPAEFRPAMSDPALPAMGEGRVKDLPATYDVVASFSAAKAPAFIPVLGPPLPGDIGAIASASDPYGGDELNGGALHPSHGGYAPSPSPDSAETEAQQALRSDLFFSLREPQKAAINEALPGPAATRASHPLTALAPQELTGDRMPDASLHSGAVIAASLVTAINSEAPGPVIAQVTHPVYDSATGRTQLIPQGARLIGEYSSAAKYGQSRLAISWSRLIMPDGREIALDEAAVDPSGAAGLEGKVDNHWGEVFGAAALGTLINIGVASTDERPTIGLTYGGVGVVGADPAEAAAREGVQRGASIVTNRVVDRALAIAPTVRIDAGVRVSVIVTRRLSIRP